MYFRNDLIHECWAYNPTNRPRISTIIQMLNNNPPLVEPCLEAPLLPLIDEVWEYEELQQFRVKLRKKSNTNASHLKQISSLDRLPLRQSHSHSSLISGSPFHWVGDILQKDIKKRNTSSALEETLQVTEPLTSSAGVLRNSTPCLDSANHIDYSNETVNNRKSQALSLVDDKTGVFITADAVVPDR